MIKYVTVTAVSAEVSSLGSDVAHLEGWGECVGGNVILLANIIQCKLLGSVHLIMIM